MISALLIAALVREREHRPQPDVHLVSGMVSLPVEFRKYLVGVGVASLGHFANTLLILWATQAWTPMLGLARAAQLAMLYYVGYNVVYAASCYVSGQLADRPNLPRESREKRKKPRAGSRAGLLTDSVVGSHQNFCSRNVK